MTTLITGVPAPRISRELLADLQSSLRELDYEPALSLGTGEKGEAALGHVIGISTGSDGAPRLDIEVADDRIAKLIRQGRASIKEWHVFEGLKRGAKRFKHALKHIVLGIAGGLSPQEIAALRPVFVPTSTVEFAASSYEKVVSYGLGLPGDKQTPASHMRPAPDGGSDGPLSNEGKEGEPFGPKAPSGEPKSVKQQKPGVVHGAALHAAVLDYMRANRGVSYSDALLHVTKEQPRLAAEYRGFAEVGRSGVWER